MRKRNKRTDILAHLELAPLTEHILAQMGQEGANIRERLTVFFRERACQVQGSHNRRTLTAALIRGKGG